MRYNRLPNAADYLPSSGPSGALLLPGSFILCPLALLQGLTGPQRWSQWSIYQLAFEQAQAQLRPSLPERDLLAVWN
jgi:hypothetical protein